MSDVSEVTFTTAGRPAPQGSKNRFGGEANPRVKGYREALSADASIAMAGRPLLIGPVSVGVIFAFSRPKSHYRAGKHAGSLRANPPRFVSVQPDIDKLCRAVGDALSGIVFRDDAQIAVWSVAKVYAETERTLVRVDNCDDEIITTMEVRT